MADYEPTDDTPQLSDTDTSEDESAVEQVETLVAGRERRKTAGNRYDRDMVLEEAAPDAQEPDEVTLLFQDDEEEEDEEFKSSEGEDDADMSSSDDDDQGPNAAAEDLEGEKELQKQAKDERAKKRKADLALTSVAGLRKKLKTDPTRPAVASTQANPSKKKERVTWVHDQDSGRSSLRKQTIAHRAETIARLKESEAQSKKMKALKQQRERERARDAPKELTQADRLAEAARVERQNAKSLNRWEAMERKRQAEQAEKLAALKNRKLDGPVVSWWSAKATWIGPRLNKIGTKDAGDVIEGGIEPKKRGRKPKAYHEQMAAAKNAGKAALAPGQTGTELSSSAPANPDQAKEMATEQPTDPAKDLPQEMPKDTPKEMPKESFLQEGTRVSAPEPAQELSHGSPQETTHDSREGLLNEVAPKPAPERKPEEPHQERQEEAHKSPEEGPQKASVEKEKITESAPSHKDIREKIPSPAPQTAEDAFLKGIHEYANMEVDSGTSEGHKEDAVAPNPDTERLVEQKAETHSNTDTQPPNTLMSLPQTEGSSHNESDQVEQGVQIKSEAPEPERPLISTTVGPSAVAEPPPAPEHSTRNLVFLEKFEELSNEARQQFSLFYNQRRTGKQVKHSQELCGITGLPVRYQDRSTGIGFASVVGYKKLQELKEYRFSWSGMLGCYVGREGLVARGVPEGFSGTQSEGNQEAQTSN